MRDWSTLLTDDEKDALFFLSLDWNSWIDERLANFIGQSKELKERQLLEHIEKLPQLMRYKLNQSIINFIKEAESEET